MPCGRVVLGVPVLVALLLTSSFAGPVALFPRTNELASPDGRLIVRNVTPDAPAAEFVGSFHSLWLTEPSTGLSRKLCDYVGIAAVAWSGDDFLVITEYLGKRTSRVLLFDVSQAEHSAVLDLPTLIRLIPVQFRDGLRQNDHVFIEASEIVTENLKLRVWGYGQHDPNGFSWRCEYTLGHDAVSCHEPK